MHRCDNADNKTTALNATGETVSIYQDEQSGVHPATQLRHTEMNAIQEEIANVIRYAGAILNSDTETIAEMKQLKDAIAALIQSSVSAEGSTRAAADAALQSSVSALQTITNKLFITGTIGCRLMTSDVTAEQTGVLSWQRNGRQVLMRLPNLGWASNSTTLRLFPLSGQSFPNEIMLSATDYTRVPISSVTDRANGATSGEYAGNVRLPMYSQPFFDFGCLRTNTLDFLNTGGVKGISAGFITYFVDHD